MTTGQSQSEIVQRILAQRGLSDAQLTLASAIGRVESGNGRSMRNPRSTASGYFQFLDGTFQEQLSAIRRRDPATAREMERLGKDHPFSQAHAYAEYSANAENALRRALGRDPTATDMYAAHFFGAGGAARVLRAPGNTPVSSLVDGNVMAANPHLRGMTVDGFRQYYEQRLSVAGDVAGFVFSNPTLNPLEPEARAAVLQGLRDSGRAEDATRLERELGERGPARSAAFSELQRIQQELLRAGNVEPNNNNLHLAQKFGAPAAIRIANNRNPEERLSNLGVSEEAYAGYIRESRQQLANATLSPEQRTRLDAALAKPHGEATAGDLGVIAEARGQQHEREVAQRRGRVGSYRNGRPATEEEADEERRQNSTLDSLMMQAMSNPLMMIMMLIMMVVAPQLMQNFFPGMGQQGGGQQREGEAPEGQRPPASPAPAQVAPAPVGSQTPAPAAPTNAPPAGQTPQGAAAGPATTTPPSPPAQDAPPASRPDQRTSLTPNDQFASLLTSDMRLSSLPFSDIPDDTSLSVFAPTVGGGGSRQIG
jgi:hypothetical protein